MMKCTVQQDLKFGLHQLVCDFMCPPLVLWPTFFGGGVDLGGGGGGAGWAEKG